MVLTGADGQLRFQGATVGKVRDWSVTINRDALETSCLSEYDRTYVPGLRGTSGSATVLYDPENTTANQFINSIWSETADQKVDFVFNRHDSKSFSCVGFITSIGTSVSVGAVQAVSVSFQVVGKPAGVF